jgi:hypothetical protein
MSRFSIDALLSTNDDDRHAEEDDQHPYSPRSDHSDVSTEREESPGPSSIVPRPGLLHLHPQHPALHGLQQYNNPASGLHNSSAFQSPVMQQQIQQHMHDWIIARSALMCALPPHHRQLVEFQGDFFIIF